MIYDCFRKCECIEPDFNDTLVNDDGEICIHCDVCGGVPEYES